MCSETILIRSRFGNYIYVHGLLFTQSCIYVNIVLQLALKNPTNKSFQFTENNERSCLRNYANIVGKNIT